MVEIIVFRPRALSRRLASRYFRATGRGRKFRVVTASQLSLFERKRTLFGGASNVSRANMLQKSKRNEIITFARTWSYHRGAAEVIETVEQACLAQTSSTVDLCLLFSRLAAISLGNCARMEGMTFHA